MVVLKPNETILYFEYKITQFDKEQKDDIKDAKSIIIVM